MYQYTTDHRDLQRSRCDPKDDRLKEKSDALCPPINSSSKTTRLSAEMKLQVKIQQVLECLSCDFAYRSLADTCENGIEEFTRKRSTNTGGSILQKWLFSMIEMRKKITEGPYILL